MTLLDKAVEDNRQDMTGDDKFWKKLFYWFELRVPAHLTDGQGEAFFYPLIINPNNYTLTEPFAVDRAFTNGGGLFLEEQGIIAREITISGNTGFKPRALPRNITSATTQIRPPENRSYGRELTRPRAFAMVEAISGQRHFQFLQDTVFRTYADLKKDPSTAEETAMFFHIAKDNESWRVHPLEFRLERSADNPLIYNYTIRMIASEKATEPELAKEDKPVLDVLKDVYKSVRTATATIRAAIQDLSGVQGEVRTKILAGADIISDFTRIADAGTDFLEGTQEVINLPYVFVQRTNLLMDSLLATYNQAVTLGTEKRTSDAVENLLRRMQDGAALIGTFPERFQTTVDVAVAKYNAKLALSTSQTSQALEAAEEEGPPATLRAFNRDVMGSSLLSGDNLRASNELALGRNAPKYTSASPYSIEMGDTVANLAAKYLGDARLWRYLVIFNDLKPPYISEEAIPGTLSVGDTILIPNFGKPPQAINTAVVAGVRPEQPTEEQVLGVDSFLENVGPEGRGIYDLAVDVSGGSTDFRVVRGVANLQQGIRSRLLTDKGSDLLYKNLGVPRVVGLGLTAVDLETAQFRIVGAVQDDPRIASISRLRVLESADASQADRIELDIEAQVRGFNQPVTILINDQ